MAAVSSGSPGVKFLGDSGARRAEDGECEERPGEG